MVEASNVEVIKLHSITPLNIGVVGSKAKVVSGMIISFSASVHYCPRNFHGKATEC